MTHFEQNALRVELLRMRAAVERAELRAALVEFRSATRLWYGLVGVASRITQRVDDRGLGALATMLLALVRARPLLLSTLATLAVRRGVPRWALLGGVAALCAWWVRSAVNAKQSDREPA
jgi:hypothetical protein